MFSRIFGVELDFEAGCAAWPSWLTMCRSQVLPGLMRSLHVRHLTLARRFREAEPEPCHLPSPFSPSLSLSTPLNMPTME